MEMESARRNDAIAAYVAEISRIYGAGMATEYSYRSAIMKLVGALTPNLVATNEPKRIACGAPDIILTEKDVPVGYIETKAPFDDDLEGRAANKEQFERYLASLDKIIFTDFLRFRFYEHGEFKTEIVLGRMSNEIRKKWKSGESFMSDDIVPDDAAFELFATTFASWCAKPVQSIKRAGELSRMMAGKARQIAYVIEHALARDLADGDDLSSSDATLRAQYEVFRQLLIHDLSAELFADTYAQTVVYGMFAARLHDETLDTFDRHEAAELIPKSNPFLRSLFGYISGPDLDDRVRPFIDDLAAVFRASDVRRILAGGKSEKQFARDPMIHFYEDFLREYDALLRKSRGVWYTPPSVVQFIVRGVDAILRSEFGLKDGLADTSKIRPGVHRVQVLDPACGTGTFLAEIIRLVRDKPRFAKMPGLWPEYAAKELVPRLNGFELLMASYAIAHIKLELLLEETGAATAPGRDRLHVFLTNSLEPPNPYVGTLLAYWLAKEAEAADRVKSETPVFVVVGNPPYSGESFNKGAWIAGKVDDYKRDPSGTGTVPDTKWLNDDYVKFIRFGQHLIEKTGEGVLAFITPHGWLNAPTFRGMRHALLTAFDSIYVLDLHGNYRKKEKTPDGAKDENVFDIQQGVEITFFVKCANVKMLPIANSNSQLDTGNIGTDNIGPGNIGTGNTSTLATFAKVFHADLWGKRAEKFSWLEKTAFEDVPWQPITPTAPQYYLIPRDTELEEEYKQGFDVSQMFQLGGLGICAKRNDVAFKISQNELRDVVRDFGSLSEEALKSKYPKERNESRDRKTIYAMEDVKSSGGEERLMVQSLYRLFDLRWTYYSGKSKGFLAFPTYNVLKHLLRPNLSLIVCRRVTSSPFRHIFVTNKITEMNSLSLQTGEQSFVYPLYLYPDENDLMSGGERKPNLDPALVAKFAECVSGAKQSNPESPEHPEYPEYPGEPEITPESILHYVYAVLYSPSYRERYREFLKTDFPRVPFPKSAGEFRRLAALGARLVAIHLMESDELDDPPATYPVAGDNLVENVKMLPTANSNSQLDTGNIGTGNTGNIGNNSTCRVWINAGQYFGEVTERSWNFFIGGYQPAQKWLKDRKGRRLSPSDVIHYARILRALDLTAELMAEIDDVHRFTNTDF